ncbi:hypothetical protein [Spirillospora sp. CA-294931]|uniref:hypothetical protein n=1 Tax=Spirillospora sp. CA-294931 TaxID=3240042 RepID=UPI003D93CA30
MADDTFDELTRSMAAAFTVIVKLLAQLPIPIEVPPMSEGVPLESLAALERARSVLVFDQPLPELHQDEIAMIITDWLTGYELGALVSIAGPAPWRLAGMELAVRRIALLLEGLSEALDIDFEM